eukprot:3799987-Pleurochrysis_carterae.AAC.1
MRARRQCTCARARASDCASMRTGCAEPQQTLHAHALTRDVPLRTPTRARARTHARVNTRT